MAEEKNEKQPAVLEVELTNAKKENERLSNANEKLAQDLEKANKAIKTRAEEVKKLTADIASLKEQIEALTEAANKAKAGTLEQSELTVEALLTAAFDKLIKFNEELPCVENENAIRKVQDASDWLARRTSLRKAQNVEGTRKPHHSSI
jgi:uncharacterized protein YoxC